MLNPYQNISWQTVHYLPSTTHWHMTKKSRVLAAHDAGLRHFAISNYIPSHPTYPLQQNSYFEMHQSEIPSDIIESPNSEKVRFSNGNVHVSCPGSLAETYGHQWPEDEPIWSWQDKFDAILQNLQYTDGGGIVINHPLRTKLDKKTIIEMLNYDNRVLGIEVVNHRSQRDYQERGYYFKGWDHILSRGFRCFGFFNPDEHGTPPGFQKGDDMRKNNWGLGRNVLLVPQKTDHNALKAYRKGEFYGAFFGDRLKFTNITFQNNTFYVETDHAERIDFISYSSRKDRIIENPIHSVIANHAEYLVDHDTSFVRAVAYENKNDLDYKQPIVSERIFTQPILFQRHNDINERSASV